MAKGVHLLKGVRGFGGRCNDLLYASSHGTDKCPKSRVVYFGGDVQNCEDNMLAHRDNQRYIKWSLEKTCLHLSMAFKNSQIFVVRPSRMYLNTFSCYDNFVDSNMTGAPVHSSDQHAIHHVFELLTSATTLIAESDTCHLLSNETHRIEDVPHVLIAFSKGCVVLNQMVYELENAMKVPHLKNFVSSIQTMYWLDGGHSGGSHVWLTDSTLLETLAKSGIEINVHLTPYQIADCQRPWIKKEEKIFSSKLQKLNAKFKRVMHFTDEDPSLDNHFRILESFTQM